MCYFCEISTKFGHFVSVKTRHLCMPSRGRARAGVQLRQALCMLSWLQTKDRAQRALRLVCLVSGAGTGSGEEVMLKVRKGRGRRELGHGGSLPG